MKRRIFDQRHEDFRVSFRQFVQREIVPNCRKWEVAGRVDREMFQAAGLAGYLGFAVPEDEGGMGLDDFRFNAVVSEELQRANVIDSGMCITLQNDVILPYLANYAVGEQRQRWLPGLAHGDDMWAICMTEPGAGSDLAAITTRAIDGGDHFVVSGAKTFVTNGMNANRYIVAVRSSDRPGHRGISLLVIEEGIEGFTRGRKLEKVGLHSQDTSELFFDEVRVPKDNLLGPEGGGFVMLMNNLPQERLALAVSANAASAAAIGWTLSYCSERSVFGQPLIDHQNTRFVLADLATALEMGQAFVDQQILRLNSGELRPQDAAKAKLWATELQQRVVSSCLQLFGGYGYMREFPIAKAYIDARIQTIYGGTSEVMKEVIARSLSDDYANI